MLAKVQLIPGFDKQVTETGAEGRWVGGSYVRFRYGLPEKIGGWEQLGSTSLVGVARDQHAWFDLAGNRYAAIGTDKILYVYYEGSFYDIHPLEASRQQAGMTNCFTTSSASPTVTVTCTSSHSLSVGDLVVFSSVSSIPGTSSFLAADFETTFEVQSVPTVSTFTITMAANETGTAFTTTGTATLDFYYVVGPALQLPGYGFGTGQFGGSVTAATTTMNNGGNLLVGATSVVLTSSASMPATGTLLIGTELIDYTANDTSTNTISGMSRGSSGTTDAEHTDGATVTDATNYTGWGSNTAAGVILDPGQWRITNFGQKLLALIYNSVVVEWDPSAAGAISNPNRATLVTGAPTASRDMLVSTPDRHLCFFGTETTIGTTTSQDDMFIRFSDQEDINNYTITANNTAGSQRLAAGSKIMSAIKGRDAIYVWTDTSLFLMQFVGSPFTFAFAQAGTNCGLIGKNAAVEVDGSAYWMSENGFFNYDGQLRSMPCLVEDFVYDSLNSVPRDLINAGVNNLFGEINWFYCSANAFTVDRVVTYNYLDSTTQRPIWTTGTLNRSAWEDSAVYDKPHATLYDPNDNASYDVTGNVDGSSIYYQHETGTDQENAGGVITAVTANIVSGDFDITQKRSTTGQTVGTPDLRGDGEYIMRIMRFIPDFINQTGDTQVSFTTRNYPNSTPVTTDFTVTSSTTFKSTRVRARSIALKVSNTSTGQDWKLGTFRLDIAPGGMR